MKKMITIKRKLKHKYNSEVGRFLMNSMVHRHRLYNHGIEWINNNNERFSLTGLHRCLINIQNTEYDYETYILGVREEVISDLKRTTNQIWKNRKDKIQSDFTFKKFNPYYNSFRIYNKHHSKIKFLDNKTLEFKCGFKRFLKIDLQEGIYKGHKSPYEFDESDIKTISFIRKNYNLYISLVIEVDIKNRFECVDKRKSVCGIDLGQANPVTLYDGKKCITIKFPDKETKRIEKRLDTLNNHLDNKEYMSNNYRKLRLKINKLYEKQFNISHNWRNRMTNLLTNNYKNIVVDWFTIPICSSGDKKQRLINRRVLSRGMSYFMETFKFMAFKYRCNLITALPNSTRTCSKCKHANEPLPLDKRKLHCVECGKKIDRDENAAINCYNQYFSIN